MNYTSTDPLDYEILIRRRSETDYASYCPQLAYMIKGTSHEEVENAMKEFILKYIESLKQQKQE
jgi:predicted RNase H-like HicB family nuclease